MLAHVLSSAVLGIDAYSITVEVDISIRMPMWNVVGLPDAAVHESRERVRSAIREVPVWKAGTL
jgi:magnesium chelatase family protein